MRTRAAVELAGSAVALLAGLACRTPPASPQPVRLAADSAAFHRQGQSPAVVPFTITNAGSRPVYLAQCGGQLAPLVDRLRWGSWSYLEGGFCNGSETSPLALPPGGSATGTIAIYQGGNYRLRIATHSDSAGSGSGEALSREFDVW
jgi:hypothetical protein